MVREEVSECCGEVIITEDHGQNWGCDPARVEPLPSSALKMERHVEAAQISPAWV